MTSRSEKASASEVVWEDPPRTPTRYDWPAIAETLVSQPNRWAKVFDRDRTSIVNAIRQGSVTTLRPEHGFEVRTRNNVRGQGSERTCSLYMRYVPEKDVRR